MTWEGTLDKVMDIHTAADILGVRPDTVKKAIETGRLHPARFIGPKHRGLWITTQDAVAQYAARRDARRTV